jgi:hypothetical protein
MTDSVVQKPTTTATNGNGNGRRARTNAQSGASSYTA